MGWITQARRRQLRAKGRQMVLLSGDVTCPVRAYAPPPQASQITDGVAQAGFVAQIMADEANAAGITPAQKMRLRDGPRSYVLTDATPVYDGEVVCGWTLISAGGA